jgi:hypothetical protein
MTKLLGITQGQAGHQHWEELEEEKYLGTDAWD